MSVNCIHLVCFKTF